MKKELWFYTERWLDGGIEKFLINAIISMKNYSKDHGDLYNIKILTSQKESNIYDEELKNNEIELISFHKPIKNIFKRTLINMLTFKRNLKKYKIDILHVNLYNAIGLFYANEAKKCGINIVTCHAHNTGIDNDRMGIKKIIHAFLKRIFSNKMFLYLACSKNAANFCFVKKYASQAKIIKNGIDLEKFKFDNGIRNSMRKELGIGNEIFLIGNVGRFVEQKNQEFLIKVFDIYNKINPKSKLVLVGSGKLEKKLKAMVSDFKLENNVIFLGQRSDVNKLMSAFDLFIIPSLYEGLGIVAIEAQAEGLKCICSKSLPEETCVTKNIIYLDAAEYNIENWCKKIEECRIYKRLDCSKKMRNAGYDDKKIGCELYELYR